MIAVPDFYAFEQRARQAGHRNIIGIDEAGRGPLAGPVVAAGVSLPEGWELEGLNDSKALSAKERAGLFQALTEHSGVDMHWARRDPDCIDRDNILQATHQAMGEAARAFRRDPDFILVDGRPVPGLPCLSEALVKGDARCASIAADSIIAKVTRDRIMEAYDRQFPEYGFAQHKGYGTKAHLEALRRHGPCVIHRRTFRPVTDAIRDDAP